MPSNTPEAMPPEFVQRMKEEYADSPIDVEAEIADALNHKAVRKHIRIDLYVQKWLRRSDQWAKERAGRKPRASRPDITTDHNTDFFEGVRT